MRSTEEAAAAYMRGEIRRYLELMKPAVDYTLMSPLGGEPTRGHDDSDDRAVGNGVEVGQER